MPRAGTVNAVVATAVLFCSESVAEEDITLGLQFGGQPMSRFSCISNRGQGFSTTELWVERGTRLTAAECLAACLEEDVPFGALGCCESTDDGRCILYQDATFQFDPSTSSTSYAIGNTLEPVCPALHHTIVIRDNLICPATRTTVSTNLCPADPSQLDDAGMQLKTNALMAELAGPNGRMWTRMPFWGSDFNEVRNDDAGDYADQVELSDVLLDTRGRRLTSGDTAITIQYRPGSPLDLDSLGQIVDDVASTQFAMNWCGCRLVGTVVASTSTAAADREIYVRTTIRDFSGQNVEEMCPNAYNVPPGAYDMPYDTAHQPTQPVRRARRSAAENRAQPEFQLSNVILTAAIVGIIAVVAAVVVAVRSRRRIQDSNPSLKSVWIEVEEIDLDESKFTVV